MSLPGRNPHWASGRSSPPWERPNMSLRRMVLVGKTGAGKSSSGNTILGRRGFRAAKSGSSITKECWKETELVGETQVVLVDTPGLFDDTLSDQDLQREISKCINMTAPGPHAIVLVIQLGPFTEEEWSAVLKIRAIFGEEADKYTIILFTHGDQLSGPIEDHLREAQDNLKRLLDLCGGRYHVFDNTNLEDRTQVLEFLDKVENMIEANGGENYTNPMLENVEEKLREKEEELKRLYESKIQQLERQLTSKFNEEKRELEEAIIKLKESDQEKEKKVKQLNRLVKKKDRELKEYKRFYVGKCRDSRLEAEQIQLDENVPQNVVDKLKNIRI